MSAEPLSNRFPSFPPQPKPFHMTDAVFQNGLWVFWLTAEETALLYINALNCVLPFAGSPLFRRPGGRVLVSINPRYDHLEAWTWIHALLEAETQAVDLADGWEEAINYACEHQGIDDA